jgi:two-component system, cell cycle sensor histidine kinase and response regulator CckA
LPRWYERPIVQLLFSVLVAAVVLGGFRWRVRGMVARERELARRVDERTRDLNQLNEQLEQRVVARTAELENEKERLAVTLRSIGDAVVATDVDGSLVLMNRIAEQLTGWSSEEAKGRRLSEVVRLLEPTSRQAKVDLVSSVLAGRATWSLPSQSLLQRRDGTEIVVAESLASIRDHRSRTVGVVLVFRDITEQRKVEERLQGSQRLEALGILAGGIAHDFNNLLMGIFGYLDLARRRASRPEETEPLSRALAVIERARGLTSQLLTFSRGGEPITAPLALGDLLRGSAEFALSGSNVVCELRVAPDLWPCEGDRQQVDQVVDNLLLNARQAMPAGGTVQLTADNVVVTAEQGLQIAPGRYVRITVRDQGVGIPPEIVSRIFEPFFTTKAEGTGLGLATSYSIVRRHRGCIEVESQPGSGTTFLVYLPAAARPVADHGPAAAGAGTRRGRILLMDDQDFVREVVCGLLEELGHEVVAVADGEAALLAVRQALARAEPFDAALLDLTIPRGDSGQVVLSRLHELDPDVPAIATSGYSGDPVMADPQAHGFTTGLTKPFTIDELSAAIARVLAARAARRS